MEKLFEKSLSVIWNVGILILIFIFSDILITTFLQFLKISMSPLNIILSVIISLLAFFSLRRKKIEKEYFIILISILLTCCLIVFCIVVSNYFLDTTVDGNFYHKTAVGAIKEGWNPVYESSYDFNIKNNTKMADEKSSLWMDHYPKATWNFAASIYSVTGNVESGKAIIFMLMISLSCLTFVYLTNRHLKIFQSIIISILIVLNPITCSQLASYYVDGIMGILVYSILLFLIIISDEKFKFIEPVEKWFGLGASIILCMNIKFTGIFFSGILCFAFYITWLIKNRKEDHFKKYFINITTIFSVIVIIGIGIIGESTYIKNLIEKKNPLYPLMGEGKVDIITTMQPLSFGQKNRILKLFESIFSKSDNVTYYSGLSPELKVPFSVSDSEVASTAIPDLRIGGFGILFSGILVCSTIFIIIGMYLLYKNDKNKFLYLCVVFLSIIIATIALDEAWWARYSPQLYLIPIISLFLVFNSIKYFKGGIYKSIIYFLGVILALILIRNVSYFIEWRIKDFINSRKIITEINIVKQSNLKQELKIALKEKSKFGILYNLDDNKLNYELIEYDENMNKYFYNWIWY